MGHHSEWELVARGYQALRYPWGDDWEDGRRVCWDKQRGPKGGTSSVFDHPDGVSPFGSFQQSGNLWEWCEDGWEDNVYQRYDKGDFELPKGSGSRVLRGASWRDYDPKYFRGGARDDGNPGGRGYYYGLRASRTVTF
jgi:formylglycine-generating enzyme required for sulfatase activity